MHHYIGSVLDILATGRTKERIRIVHPRERCAAPVYQRVRAAPGTGIRRAYVFRLRINFDALRAAPASRPSAVMTPKVGNVNPIKTRGAWALYNINTLSRDLSPCTCPWRLIARIINADSFLARPDSTCKLFIAWRINTLDPLVTPFSNDDIINTRA